MGDAYQGFMVFETHITNNDALLVSFLIPLLQWRISTGHKMITNSDSLRGFYKPYYYGTPPPPPTIDMTSLLGMSFGANVTLHIAKSQTTKICFCLVH